MCVFCFLFWRERERESAHMCMGERRKGGEGGWGWRERIPSRLLAASVEPKAGFEPTNHEIMTRAEIKAWTPNRVSHPGAPIRDGLLKPSSLGPTLEFLIQWA